MELDRTSPIPLWAQIDRDLRDRILSGAFDDRFPTEPELMSTYQVSRSTVRQAVAELERSGLIERRRGIGTRVTERRLVDSMARMYSMAGWIASAGLPERSIVPVVELAPLPDPAADRLDQDPGSHGVHVVRIRYAGDDPLAIDRSWLPMEVGRLLLDEDLTSGSLYDRLAYGGVIPTGSTEQVHPIDPDPDDRELLDLPPTEMAFEIERIVHAGATPVEYRVSIVRGDGYTLTATWGSPPPD